MEAWLTMRTRSAAIITVRRDRRSARTPPASSNATVGSRRAANTRPSALAESETSSTAKARATGTIPSPSSDTACPANSTRKFRSRSALSASGNRIARQATVRLVSAEGRAAAERKMREHEAPAAAIRTCLHHYDALVAGEEGTLPDRDLAPVDDVASLERLGPGDESALDRTVVVKLNGGLGTSMGLTRAKSLIEAKDGLTFLDVVVRQVFALRRRHGARLPLVLMNSFHTREDSLAALAGHPDLAADVPPDFLQHQEPRLRAADLSPVTRPDRPALEWCPPGHGDVYTALLTSGMLATLRERGYDFAFLSNVDNLGAVLDPRILAWFAAGRIPFLMEVVTGTEADRKGGHIARRRADGRLVLRETAQVPAGDEDSFRDVGRWRFYNTNSLWVDLAALEGLARGNGLIDLPLIVNRKTEDPADPASAEVIQLETAMGAAIGAFDGARALHVPRSRFAPVKTTDDLLVLRSDALVLTPEARVEPAPGVDVLPFVALDPDHSRSLSDFEERFPHGAPSLAGAERLVVHGDVTFGRDVVVRGSIDLDARDAPRTIPAGTVLEGQPGSSCCVRVASKHDVVDA
jgi:UTP--glucose-1-phosphate uridylyltransferase